jgi:hypothetical protein
VSDLCITRRDDLIVKNYDSVGETRSLTGRSRTPDIVSGHAAVRSVFEGNQREWEGGKRQTTEAKRKAMRYVEECPPRVLSGFIERSQRIPIERKREVMLGVEEDEVAAPPQKDQAAEEDEGHKGLEPRSGVYFEDIHWLRL